MANEISGQVEKIHGNGGRQLLKTPNVAGKDDILGAKHERLLALLKRQYGYTNDKAVDELERLLRQFYKFNKSMGIHHL